MPPAAASAITGACELTNTRVVATVPRAREVQLSLHTIDRRISLQERVEAWKSAHGSSSGQAARDVERQAEKLRADVALHVRKPKLNGQHIPDDQVKELNLSDCMLREIDLGAFVGLEKLSLANNHLKTLDGVNLDRLTNLQVLDLRHNKIPMRTAMERASVMKHIADLPNLQLLGLAHNDDKVDRRPNLARKTLFDGMKLGGGDRRTRGHRKSISIDSLGLHRRGISMDSGGDPGTPNSGTNGSRANGALSPSGASGDEESKGNGPPPRLDTSRPGHAKRGSVGSVDPRMSIDFDAMNNGGAATPASGRGTPSRGGKRRETAAQKLELHCTSAEWQFRLDIIRNFPRLQKLGCPLRFLDDEAITPHQIVRAFRSKKRTVYVVFSQRSAPAFQPLTVRMCGCCVPVCLPQQRHGSRAVPFPPAGVSYGSAPAA